MKAIFSVEFKKRDMCDQKTIDEEYNGSWFKMMRWLFKQEGLGIFSKELKLIRLED